MDPKILAKTILLVWFYFTYRILFVTYWDALFLPPILLILDSLLEDSKSNIQTQTGNHFQARKKKSENNKEVRKEQDQNLTVKEIDSEKIQELISDLQNSLTSDSKNGAASPNFSTFATKLENPAEKIISTTKISASSEDNLKNDTPNFSTFTTKLENPAEKIISTSKISASLEEDNLKNGKTSPAIHFTALFFFSRFVFTDYDMELPTDQATIMDYAQAVSLPSSGSSTPQVAHCNFLQLCKADIRKYTIMHTGVVTLV
ncbi:hypothetical protein TNCV_2807191 [Trichonephila clavipes]|nr:hypothetical protein TNCV_2807191 [Trichonephila clavipes]